MKIPRFEILLLFITLAALTARAETFSGAKFDLVVDAGGKGDVKTIGEAIAKVPAKNRKRFVIFIKAGIYNEQIRIPADKPFITFLGENAETTKLTFNLNNKRAGTTSAAYAVYIGGHDFHAENITFENSFDFTANAGKSGSQAVAVISEADRLLFKNCKFLGWQDTLYAKNGRQYFENCYVEGNVDFIFGQAAAVFDNCVIHSKGDGYIAAPMRFAADEPSGFVFINSKLTGEQIEKGVFLARPWRAYGRTVFINTEMDAHIRAEGWNNWNSAENEKTAYFAEYNSKGAGAKMNERAKWIRRLSKEEAKKFEPESFLKGLDGWNPKTAKDDWLERTLPGWRTVFWSEIFEQIPLWYQTDEAARIADQAILYQKDNGGWEKNIDMALILTEVEKENLLKSKSVVSETTIDNRASYTQLRFLAKMITESLKKKTPPNNFPLYKESFNKGFDYLISAQYDNGGFPQFYPLKKGYYTHITYNDDAMIGVLNLFKDIAEKDSDFIFVDEERRLAAEKGFRKGLDLTLKLQIVIDGKKTVWAAQYDENTLKPANARAFEPASLTGGESVNIVRFLMSLKNPDAQVVEAVEAAIEWYRKNKILGVRMERKQTAEGWKYSLVKDANGEPLWGRFYQIETMKPIFIGRNAIIKYDISEIEAERAGGYTWFVSNPKNLIEKEYPKWKAKIKKS